MSAAARGALRRFAASLASDRSRRAHRSITPVGTFEHPLRSFASGAAKPAEFTFGDEDQARRYDDALAWRVFRPWCDAMVEINEPVPGNKCLDLACGTVRPRLHLRCPLPTRRHPSSRARSHAYPRSRPLTRSIALSTQGINTMLLASHVGDKVSGGRVVGVDVSRGMLKVAEAKANDLVKPGDDDGPGYAPVQFHFGDACAEDTPWHEPFPHHFDRAYCHQGLQFMADPIEALTRVRSALIPGGQFTCAVWAPVEHQPLFLAVHRALAGTANCFSPFVLSTTSPARV